MSALMSLLSTNLSSFYLPMANPSSSEIKKNDYNNLISDNAENNGIVEFKIVKSVL